MHRQALLLTFLCLLFINTASHSETLKTLVILVNFADTQSSVSQQTYEQLFNSDDYNDVNSPISVNEYIQENSAGRLSIDATITNRIYLPENASYYITIDDNSINEGPLAMFQDAITVLEQQNFDFSPFDNDGDGELELVGIIHRGSNSSYGVGIAPDWSTVPNFLPMIKTGDYSLRRGWMITDSNPAFDTITTIGGISHEMVGHTICNIPDLYDWNPGSWAYMYGGSAFNPSHFRLHKTPLWLEQHLGYRIKQLTNYSSSKQFKPSLSALD